MAVDEDDVMEIFRCYAIIYNQWAREFKGKVRKKIVWKQMGQLMWLRNIITQLSKDFKKKKEVSGAGAYNKVMNP